MVETVGTVTVHMEASEDLRAFIRAEVRKALAEELALSSQQMRPRGWFLSHMETKAVAPPREGTLPAWARHEEGARP